MNALLAFLFPVFAMLVGAGLGSLLAGSHGATALGAIAGFLGALAILRIAIDLIPCRAPAPQGILLSQQSPLFREE